MAYLHYRQDTVGNKMRDIPAINEELEKSLGRIIEENDFQECDRKEWEEQMFPEIIQRVENLSRVGREMGNGEKNAPQELLDEIEHSKQRFERTFKEKFAHEPPFTIIRLAELLLQPREEGYDLIDCKHIFKYLKALAKTVLVSSSVFCFPGRTTITSEIPESDVSPNVRFEEITWLNNTIDENAADESSANLKETESVPSSATDDEYISQVLISSNLRRGHEDEAVVWKDSKRVKV